MIDRYLMLVANYASRDQSMIALLTLALGAVLWLPVIESSPLIPARWRDLYWMVILAGYTIGMLILSTI